MNVDIRRSVLVVAFYPYAFLEFLFLILVVRRVESLAAEVELVTTFEIVVADVFRRIFIGNFDILIVERISFEFARRFYSVERMSLVVRNPVSETDVGSRRHSRSFYAYLLSYNEISAAYNYAYFLGVYEYKPDNADVFDV